MLENAASRYCVPEISFNSKEWIIEGKKILEVRIRKGDNPPHKAPGPTGKMRAYVRVNDQNILANGVRMKIWQKLNNNSDVKLVYSDDTKKLLDLFNHHENLTLSQINSEMQLSKFKTENLLSKLVVMNVLKMTDCEFDATFEPNDPDKTGY